MSDPHPTNDRDGSAPGQRAGGQPLEDSPEMIRIHNTPRHAWPDVSQAIRHVRGSQSRIESHLPDADVLADLIAERLQLRRKKPDPVTLSELTAERIRQQTKTTERDATQRALKAFSDSVGICGAGHKWRLDQTVTPDRCPECQDPRTNDPGIQHVDRFALSLLVASMTDDGYSAATADNRVRYLMPMLRMAHDRRLIDSKIRKPDVETVPPIIRVFSENESQRFHVACDHATWNGGSQRFTAPELWKAFHIWSLWCGQRIGEAFSLQWRKPSKRTGTLTDGIYDDPQIPHPAYRRLGLTSPRGWLVYLPAKQARAKPAQLIIPIPDMVADAIAPLRRAAGPSDFVFDVYADVRMEKNRGSYTSVKKSLYSQWHRLCDLADFPEDDRPTPHDLRRTQETIYDSTVSPGAGAEVNGHSKRTVSSEYYSLALPRIHHAVFAVKLPVFPKGHAS